MLAKASLQQTRSVRIAIGDRFEDLSPADARILAFQLHAHADKADALSRAEAREAAKRKDGA